MSDHESCRFILQHPDIHPSYYPTPTPTMASPVPAPKRKLAPASVPAPKLTINNLGSYSDKGTQLGLYQFASRLMTLLQGMLLGAEADQVIPTEARVRICTAWHTGKYSVLLAAHLDDGGTWFDRSESKGDFSCPSRATLAAFMAIVYNIDACDLWHSDFAVDRRSMLTALANELHIKLVTDYIGRDLSLFFDDQAKVDDIDDILDEILAEVKQERDAKKKRSVEAAEPLAKRQCSK